MKAAIFAGVAALGVGGLVFAAITASRPEPGATPTQSEVYARTMSPFCPGITLAECTTNQSADLKQEISTKVDQGWTNREIDNWLVATYGREVLGRPGGMAIWLAPLIAGAVAAGGAALFVTKPRAPNSGPDGRASKEELARVQQELDQFGMSTE